MLGITKFDEQIFKNRVSKIVVPSKGNLKFILNDGNAVLKMWDYPSRRDSWTEEMRDKARNSELNRRKDEEKCVRHGQ